MHENLTQTPRFVAIDYLRGFVVLLVVLHHAVLAYYPLAPAPGAPMDQLPFAWAIYPVVDTQRSGIFTLLVAFNDMFFMALMFFISGLFVPRNLERKGVLRFLTGRLLRLGVPFIVAAAVLGPLAYYPSYLQSGASGWDGFLRILMSLPFWPSGPAWFLWVLFVFGAIAGILYLVWPRWTAALAHIASGADRHPWRFLFGLILVAGAGYIAMSIIFDPYRWLSCGPFSVQASRIVHYAVYFLAGIAIGAFGLTSGLLSPEGKLAKRWWLYLSFAIPAFFAVIAVIVTATAAKGNPPALWETVGGAFFALTCGLTSFALLGLFVRLFRHPNRVLDSLARNSYGIYLIHYAFVSWAQWMLLPTQLGGLLKALIVLVTAVALSWATVALLRRIPGVGRVL